MVKFGGKFFQTKLLSRLSHKICRLLPLSSSCVSSLSDATKASGLNTIGIVAMFTKSDRCAPDNGESQGLSKNVKITTNEEVIALSRVCHTQMFCRLSFFAVPLRVLLCVSLDL